MRKMISRFLSLSLAVAITAMSLGLTSSAFAFSDTNGNFAENYINTLTSKGVISGYPDGSFRPNNTVARAEALKMITKSKILVDRGFGYDFSATSSFSDVRPSDWFYVTVVTANKKGWISGYSDGRFGPGDPVTREQFAKMIVKALGIPSGNGATSFSDTDGSFAKEDIAKLASWGLVSGYSDGRFGANDPMTRAAVAKILGKIASSEVKIPFTSTPSSSNNTDTNTDNTDTTDSTDTTDTNTDTTDTTDNTDTVSDTGTYDCAQSACFADDYPTELNVPIDANSPVAKLILKSADAAYNVSQIKVKFTGLAQTNSIDYLGVYDSDNETLIKKANIDQGTSIATLAGMNISVPKSGDKELFLRIAFKSTATNVTNISLKIEAEGITASDENFVQDTALVSKVISVSTGRGILGDVLVTEDTSTPTDNELSVDDKLSYALKFTETSSSANILIKKITITNDGSADFASDLKDVKFTLGDVAVGASTEDKGTISISNDRISVSLASGYELKAGKSVVAKLEATVIGGNGRTFEPIIDNSYDLLMTSNNYPDIYLSQDSSFFPINRTGYGKFTVKQGTVSVRKSTDSPSSDIPVGGEEVPLYKVEFSAMGEDVILSKIIFADTVNTNWSTNITSLKLMAGTETLGTATTLNTSNNTIGDTVTINVNDYVLPKGKNTSLVLYGNISSTQSTASAPTIQLKVSSMLTEGAVSGKSITVADQPVSNTLTVTAVSASVNKNLAFDDKGVVKGGHDVDVAQFQVTASSAEDVRLSSVSILGDVDMTNNFDRMSLIALTSASGTGSSNETVLKEMTTLTTTTTFSGLNYIVKKGETKTFVVRGDIKVGAVDNAIVVKIPSNGVTMSGVLSGVSSTLPSSALSLQTVSVYTSGTLASEYDLGDLRQNSQSVLGTKDVVIGKFKFTTANIEPITVNKLHFQNVGANTNSWYNFRLYKDTTLVKTFEGSLSTVNGIAKSLVFDFGGTPYELTQDETATLTLKADSAKSGTSGEDVKMILVDNQVVGSRTDVKGKYSLAALSVGDVSNPNAADVSANALAIQGYKTKPTFAWENTSAVASGGANKEIGRFTITNPANTSNASITIQNLAFTTNGNVAYRNVRLYNNAKSTNVVANNGSSLTFTGVNYQVPKDTSYTFSIYADLYTTVNNQTLDLVFSSGSISTAGSMTWGDGSVTGITWTDITDPQLSHQGANIASATNPSASAIVSATLNDTNNDGRIDSATVVYNSNLLTSSLNASDWKIGGTTASTITPASTDGTTFTITVAGGVAGTGTTNVTFTNANGEKDLAGSALANIGNADVTEVDNAAPVLMSLTKNDVSVNGVLNEAGDSVSFIFSEGLSTLTPITGAQLQSALQFAGTATNGSNIPSDATITYTTTNYTNDTIVATYNATSSANLLNTGATATVISGTNILDTTSKAANTSASARTLP